MLVYFDVGGQLGMPFFIIIDYWTHFVQKQRFKVNDVFVSYKLTAFYFTSH